MTDDSAAVQRGKNRTRKAKLQPSPKSKPPAFHTDKTSHLMTISETKNVKYYWEDMPVGSVFELGDIKVERQEVLDFARRYDPQPFHLDDEAAARSPIFGRLAASGWHVCALVMGEYVRKFLNHTASLGSPGVEQVRWLKPVYPGDTLRARLRVTDARPMKSRPTAGLVRSEWQAFNQDGVQVLSLDGWGMFTRRTPGEPPAA